MTLTKFLLTRILYSKMTVQELIVLLQSYSPNLDVAVIGLDGTIDYIDDSDFEVIINKEVDDDLIILNQSNYDESTIAKPS